MTLTELFEAVLPKIGSEPQAATFLDAVNTVQEVIAHRLWALQSELLEGDFEGSVALGDDVYYLPKKVLGLRKDEHPWILYDGQRYDLLPLPPARRDRVDLTTDSRPKYYRLRGRKIQLFPATDKAITLKGEGFLKPAKIEAMEEELPFDGLFDDVFVDAVTRFGASGLGLAATQQMQLFLYQQVDMRAIDRPNKAIFFRYPG